MKHTVVLLLCAISVTNCISQSIRKSGASYLGASYGFLKHGKEVSIKYESYFIKGYSYFLMGSLERSLVGASKCDSYKFDIGLSRSLPMPLEDLYINVPAQFYLGREQIKNEYYRDKDGFIYGISVRPNLEYFIFNNLSFSAGASMFLDFNSMLRNRHYSYFLSIQILL